MSGLDLRSAGMLAVAAGAMDYFGGNIISSYIPGQDGADSATKSAVRTAATVFVAKLALDKFA